MIPWNTDRFREDVRRWLETHTEPRTSDDGAGFIVGPDLIAVAKDFQRRLYDAGLAGLAVPEAYGGQGLSSREEIIFGQEAAFFAIPRWGLANGLDMCLYAVLDAGTDDQKRQLVPRILRGEDVWCLLFSEPNAGSDLASIESRAVQHGDDWLLNGQKVWTSNAHLADFGLLLARTDTSLPKHVGITMFILDMRSEGITIRPLRQMTGSAEFNEVFFDDVCLPKSSLVGEVNRGWSVVVGVLAAERKLISRRRNNLTSAQALVVTCRGRELDQDPVVSQRLAQLWIQERIAGWIADRHEETLLRGDTPGPEQSLGKLVQSRLAKDAAYLAASIVGPSAVAWDPGDHSAGRWGRLLGGLPATSIAGGTDEVQRNLVAERVLGLPR